MGEIQFFVPGKPAPGGSKTSFPHPATGKMIYKDAGKNNAEWRQLVAVYAHQAMRDSTLLNGPVEAEVVFRMPRPKSHYKKNGELKPDAPYWHTNKPDGTKLFRAFEDALTNIVWTDDCRVARQDIQKIYHEKPGAVAIIRLLPVFEAVGK